MRNTPESFCGFDGATNGVQEYYEYNSGGSSPIFRDSIGSPANGTYTMKLWHVTQPSNRFLMYRDGQLKVTVLDGDWRSWSLVGAKFELYAESWNLGDQLGGTSNDQMALVRAHWNLAHGATFDEITMSGCDLHLLSGHEDEYDCNEVTTNVPNDGVGVWTYNR